MDLNNHPVLVVMAIGVIAPLLAQIPKEFRVPTVVLEILLGIVIGLGNEVGNTVFSTPKYSLHPIFLSLHFCKNNLLFPFFVSSAYPKASSYQFQRLITERRNVCDTSSEFCWYFLC